MVKISRNVVKLSKIDSALFDILISSSLLSLRFKTDKMEATGLYKFDAASSEEMSFKRGSDLLVFDMEGDIAWIPAEQDGRSGLVPTTYLSFQPNKWFHGSISREEAEQILDTTSLPEGAFLIRKSQSPKGDYSLSVKHSTEIQHFLIYRNANGKYHIWDESFKSLNKLVDHYRSWSVNRSQTLYLKDSNSVVPAKATYVVALYDFTAEYDEELSLKKGDRVELLEQVDVNWSRGRSQRGEGTFPATYVKVAND